MKTTHAETAAVLAPHGRDAAVAVRMLREGGIEADAVNGVPALAATIARGAGFAIVTEEALRGADLRELSRILGEQGEWSDFPFIVLTARGGGLERNPGAVRLLDVLGNVTFLERPFHPTTLLSLARSALRARRRQYRARALVEEVRDGQERMGVALAAGGLGAWSMDLRTNELVTSADCKAQYGRGMDLPFTYDDLIASIHPEDLPRMQARAQASIAGGGDYDVAYRCVWPDRSVHWIQVNGRPEQDSRGRIVRMVGVTQDVTARRAAESRRAALLALGDGLRQLTAPGDMSFLAAQILATTLEVSRAGYGLIDRARETITIERDWNAPGTTTIAGVLHFRDYGSYIDDLKRGTTVAIADVRLDPRTAATAPQLEEIHARSFINMPLVDDGEFVALLYLNHREARGWSKDELAFVHDVADRTQAAIERRIAENALADLAQSLERQVEERTRERDRTWLNSQDLLAVLDEQGIFLAASPAWTQVLGWRPDEMVGRDYLTFVEPSDRAATSEAYRTALTGVLRNHENRIRHKDGTYRWLSWVASSEAGQVYASGRHVTAEKEARQQLEVAQDQLRQAQKMEAVGQLTGGLAHDFNNLLAGMSGALELIGKRVRQGRVGEIGKYVEMAQAATSRAAALTHRLLAFSRRQTLDPRPTDINRLVAGMEDLLRRSVGPEIEIAVAGQPDLWTTSIDHNQLENALLNLCLNARDAMPEGGRITIETANREREVAGGEDDVPPGRYVVLSVTDTGVGMTPETLERAFDPFFTTKPLGEGTGLGLSMIYGFVRQSGGRVRIRSAPGEGTRVSLFLPWAHAGAAPEAVPGNRPEPVGAADGETVLVVDDEAAVRTLVTDVLADLGYRALEADDGAAGLEIVRSTPRIDLLVTDVGLPGGMNGRQFADAVRAERPGLKVLFITGYAENAAIGGDQLDPGMQVMTKPFAIDALAGRIRDMIGAEAPGVEA